MIDDERDQINGQEIKNMPHSFPSQLTAKKLKECYLVSTGFQGFISMVVYAIENAFH